MCRFGEAIHACSFGAVSASGGEGIFADATLQNATNHKIATKPTNHTGATGPGGAQNHSRVIQTVQISVCKLIPGLLTICVNPNQDKKTPARLFSVGVLCTNARTREHRTHRTRENCEQSEQGEQSEHRTGLVTKMKVQVWGKTEQWV